MKKKQEINEIGDIHSIRELNIVIKIGKQIIGTLDYEKVLQIISDGMSELLEIETSAIYLLENENELLLGATTPPLPPQMPESLRRANLFDHPHIQKALAERKPILIPDTKTSPLSAAEKSVVEMRQLRSLLYFPFVQEEEVSGVLILGTCNKSRTYSDHEIELGQTVANQLSVAIQNAKLHADLKNHKENLEKLVEKRTHELKTLNEELQTMNSELHEKNEIVIQQKEELETTLAHLKSVQVKLVQSEKMASLGVLTAGVAHEINNPLNFMMGAYVGFDNFFTRTAPQYKKQVSLFLDGLKLGVERASDIVHGLNQFSRDNKNNDEVCDIHSIINDCLVMLHNKYKHNITIDKQYDIKGLAVKGNIGKLHQAFTNIIINAIQAIEDKGLITIITQNDGTCGKISIQDNGTGIAEENLPKITDPFFTTKDPNEGTGLGLSITYNIIREHQGMLEFESELHKGTTVFVTLPILDHHEK